MPLLDFLSNDLGREALAIVASFPVEPLRFPLLVDALRRAVSRSADDARARIGSVKPEGRA